MDHYIGMDDWAKLRPNFDTKPLCSLDIDEHEWRHVIFGFSGTIVAIICENCGRYPLEIMAQWPVVRSG